MMSYRTSTTIITALILCFLSTGLILSRPAAAAGDQQDHGKRWVMAVGICKFADTRIPQLTYCVADARTVIDYFKKDNVPADQMILLVNEDADKNTITGSLQKIASLIAPDDTLFFFYSSHGAGDNSGTTYFITFDTVGDNLTETALPMQELKEEIEAIKCRNIVLMIDTCHSGGVKSLGRQDEKAYDKLVRTADKKTRIAILTSSRTHESSMESEKWQHGAFTYYMLDGLSGASDNFPRDGRVSVTELFDYVMVAVPRATNRAQHPSAKFSYNWPGKKEEAVKVGKTVAEPEQAETSSEAAAAGRTENPDSTSTTVFDNNGWRSSGGQNRNPQKTPDKKWHNVIE